MQIAGKAVAFNSADKNTPPVGGELLIFDNASDMWIPLPAPSADEILVYSEDLKTYVPTAIEDLPVTVVGITATTLGGALAELLDAITP